MMLPLLATAAEEPSALKGLLGALHPGIVHFPIGLLAAAALFEVLQILRKKEGAAPGSLPMIYLAALSSIPACLFGFFLADVSNTEGKTLDLHKYLGLASAAVAIGAAAAGIKGRLKILRAALFVGTLLVLATGYYGGEMVMGPGHITDWIEKLFGSPKRKDTQTPPPPPATNGNALLKQGDKVDFEAQIAPIIKASCFKCHNPGKKKGKLLLDTKANAMKGGEGGPCIVPGNPDKSTFYTLLIDPDPDTRMPEKEKPLPKEQIELVKKWIEQGAPWPDGVVIK